MLDIIAQCLKNKTNEKVIMEIASLQESALSSIAETYKAEHNCNWEKAYDYAASQISPEEGNNEWVKSIKNNLSVVLGAPIGSKINSLLPILLEKQIKTVGSVPIFQTLINIYRWNKKSDSKKSKMAESLCNELYAMIKEKISDKDNKAIHQLFALKDPILLEIRNTDPGKPKEVKPKPIEPVTKEEEEVPEKEETEEEMEEEVEFSADKKEKLEVNDIPIYAKHIRKINGNNGEKDFEALKKLIDAKIEEGEETQSSISQQLIQAGMKITSVGQFFISKTYERFKTATNGLS